MSNVYRQTYIDGRDENSTVTPITSDEGAIRLAEAIVKGVAVEYKHAYQMYLEATNEKDFRAGQMEMLAKEKLIRSRYFAAITMSQLDPETIITSLRMQVEKEYRKKAKGNDKQRKKDRKKTEGTLCNLRKK